MTSEYDIDDIKKILKKIENLKERKYIERVRKIIFEENPNISTTKKTSGDLLYFHNLTQSTYKKLDILFNKLENDKLKKIKNTLSESYEKNLSDIDNSEPQIKLSNAEKKIIKKKEYHKQISQNTDDIYVSDDDIFINKN
jgi:hypothetical protein